MKWSYGITTVPKRRDDLLPRTLASLARGGFPTPRLFVDGCPPPLAVEYRQRFGLEVTARDPVIRTWGNWTLALGELYIREPLADRYALFQDDMVTGRNLREYLERRPYPESGYLNLYTFPPPRQLLSPEGRQGWYLSNQLGKGAVALVFDRLTVLTLLTHPHAVRRPMDIAPDRRPVLEDGHQPLRGETRIDGGIVTALASAGWSEWVHNPSLVQHTGLYTTMGSCPQASATSFRGEDFDLLRLL